MALDVEEVRRIAALARLELGPGEEELFVEQLGEIVEYFDRIRELEAAAPAQGEAAFEGMAAELPEAEDREAPSLERDVFLQNAPESLEGFLLVPRVKVTPEA